MISATFCRLDNFESTTLDRADDNKIDGTFDSTGVSIKKWPVPKTDTSGWSLPFCGPHFACSLRHKPPYNGLIELIFVFFCYFLWLSGTKKTPHKRGHLIFDSFAFQPFMIWFGVLEDLVKARHLFKDWQLVPIPKGSLCASIEILYPCCVVWLPLPEPGWYRCGHA